MVSNATLKIKKMKYVIALLFALTFSKIDAQNLQFSQVLTFTGQTVLIDQDISLGIVPDGKVWKIESLNQANRYCSYSVNGYSIKNETSTYTNTNTFCNLPIWLKAQDNFSFRCSYGSGSYVVSIIEFTIVP